MRLHPKGKYRLDFDAPASVDFDHFIVGVEEGGREAVVIEAPGQTWAWEGKRIDLATIAVGKRVAFNAQDGSGAYSFLNYATTAITAV